jgi:hypothetical protein
MLPAALLTMVIGFVGLLAARGLRDLAAFALIGSTGTLLLAVSLFDEAALAAALYYLPHTTLAAAALFLITDCCSAAARKRRFAGSRPPVHCERGSVGPVPADSYCNRRASSAVRLRRQAAHSRGGAAAPKRAMGLGDDSDYDIRWHRRPCTRRKHIVLEERGNGRGSASGRGGSAPPTCCRRLRFCCFWAF